MTSNELYNRISEQTERSLSAPPLSVDQHRQTSNHFYKIEEIEKVFYSHLLSKDLSRKYTFLEIGGQYGLHARHFINVFRDNIDKFVLNDLTENTVERAKARLGDFSKITDFIASPAEEISTDYQFDGIYTNASLHHFVDPFKAIKIMKKLLRPGGLFVFCEPVVWNPLNLYRAIAIKAERNQLTLARKGNIRQYLKSAGFDIISERVLHLRLNNQLFAKYRLHQKLEKIKLLNPLAVVFLFGAMVPPQDQN
ncbi:MAG: class I SAM-dependent methyltransferase [Candidatus Tantalella remota]|nr:class I SAM-dependent methyltransferase [Candidatus Tantalella remota]